MWPRLLAAIVGWRNAFVSLADKNGGGKKRPRDARAFNANANRQPQRPLPCHQSCAVRSDNVAGFNWSQPIALYLGPIALAIRARIYQEALAPHRPSCDVDRLAGLGN